VNAFGGLNANDQRSLPLPVDLWVLVPALARVRLLEQFAASSAPCSRGGL